MHDQIWTGPLGSASANRNNGKLTCIPERQYFRRIEESAWAGVYAQFRADPARYGKISRVTVDPEIHSTGRDVVDVDHRWNAQIDGTMWFDYRLWTVVYRLDVVSGQWEPLLSNRSAVTTTGRRRRAGTWWAAARPATAGRSRNGEASLAFIAEPTRTYLFGVLTEMAGCRLLASHGRPGPSLSHGPRRAQRLRTVRGRGAGNVPPSRRARTMTGGPPCSLRVLDNLARAVDRRR